MSGLTCGFSKIIRSWWNKQEAVVTTNSSLVPDEKPHPQNNLSMELPEGGSAWIRNSIVNLDECDMQSVDLAWDNSAANYRLAFENDETDDDDLIARDGSRGSKLRQSLRSASRKVNKTIQAAKDLVK
ncbi:Oidioi.mRNA.OKI2018_I69.PAR.g12858.t1.cds [Oikopleura dioica]|uniref:Oidioi.mRNA.OKI2018_I69.PAR.g12858.t1.cds n=1 Tax=Oikopleura dioica TaxID=34765 RepID=A0ABN7S7F2_OIKDI|nr:Oidioi.mRNA.OKI2018_I69.PAR.g12858.t1.cds [Oikopleura dioica]